jgi:hypothetical protein
VTVAARRSAPPAAAVSWSQVLALRLERQHVVHRATPDRLVEVVGELVGVHAQVMSAAELQLAARIDGLRAVDVREALWKQRRLVKTWAYRQTLHLLTPDDLAEFVVAARSLERWHTPAWLRYFKLAEDEVAAIIEAVGKELSDRPVTRAELVRAVTKRLAKEHLEEEMLTGWGTFLAPAAQRGHLVFGPSDGRNVAFVDPNEWLRRRIAPSPEPDAADDALARLIGRYLAAFPGASRDMLGRWWGGGRVGAVNRALARSAVELAEIDVDGMRGLIRAQDVEPLLAVAPFREVRLLPGFDPFTNELPRRVDSVLPESRHALVHRTAGWVTPIAIVDGRIDGTWEIIGNGGRGVASVTAWSRWRGGVRKELAAEIDRIAAFLDRPLRVEVETIAR